MTGLGFADRPVLERLPRFRRSASLLAQSRQDPDAFAAFYDAYAERILLFLVRLIKRA